MFLLKRKCALLFSVYSMSLLLVCLLKQPSTVDACSSRSIPKPRTLSSAASSISPQKSTTSAPTTTTTTTTTTTEPTTTTTTTPRPNITFPTYKCPINYDAWYCLNDATCFSVKLGDSVMYNCECANGFMGPRCEYKEYDGSFLPKRPRPMLEEASIASGAICALLFVLFICLTLYLRYEQRAKVAALGGDGYEIADGVEDDDEEGENTYFTTKACRHCNEKQCCGAEIRVGGGGGGIGMLRGRVHGAAEGSGGGAPTLRRYIEAFSMSFAIKRTTKL
ncbi:protein spitz [Rhagoletis pomonella]|uniref:protein spitz n=1 Tax=Rhagoletis pomonella TaxID=28610 RepID=UPI00177FB7B6|nr:protein spitz [Rhagoletis pomonella]XP_036321637.1 protein spitz [Rhagoletis pomonella]XP_036321638.1 protein spitz [Rhagoletis pomonella]